MYRAIVAGFMLERFENYKSRLLVWFFIMVEYTYEQNMLNVFYEKCFHVFFGFSCRFPWFAVCFLTSGCKTCWPYLKRAPERDTYYMDYQNKELLDFLSGLMKSVSVCFYWKWKYWLLATKYFKLPYLCLGGVDGIFV